VLLAWRRDNRSACLANFVAVARGRTRVARAGRRSGMS